MAAEGLSLQGLYVQVALHEAPEARRTSWLVLAVCAVVLLGRIDHRMIGLEHLLACERLACRAVPAVIVGVIGEDAALAKRCRHSGCWWRGTRP